VTKPSRLKSRRHALALTARSRLWLATRPCAEALEKRLFLSTTIAPDVADASVRNDTYADTNFGAAPELYIQDPTAGNDQQITFMRFNLSGISVINSATLELNGSLQTAGDPSVSAAAFAVANTTWAEGTGVGTIGVTADGITWNTQPAIGAAISGATATIASASPQIVDFNLTSYLQAQLNDGNTLVSIAIQSSTPSADYAQFDSKEGGTAPQLVIDDTPPSAPTASLSATTSNVTSGGTAETVVAEYTGPAAIQLNTIDSSNLSVTGPGSATVGGTVTVNSSNPDDVFATYSIVPPNGSSWTIPDNGSYTVALKSNQVEDANDNFAAPTSTGFSVAIPDNSPPVAGTPSAPNITTASGDTNTVTVVYTDNIAVSAGSIGTSDITISGPSAVNVTSVTKSSSSNTSPITATYTITKANGQPWAFADDGTYTITVVAGSVKDTSGNGDGTKTGSFSVSLPDTSPPVASSISAPNISVVGGDTSTVTVVYTDNVAVSAGTIATSNITVTGPSAIDITGVTTSPSSNASLITATYTITKASGQPWAFADNGTYTITVLAGSVKDTSGNGVASRTDTFSVSEPQPDTTPPTDVISAPYVTVTGGATETITVVYTDNVAVDAATIDNTSLSVTGPAGTLTLANLSKVPASNSPTITAVYIFNAPGGAWTAADNGTYTVTVPPNHVTDTSGNADAGGSTTFGVTISVPPPVALLTAPNITAPGGTTEAVTAVYTDTLGVDTSTIQPSNITVTGPHGALTVASASFTGSGKTVTATYLVDAPGGAWATAANGSYSVSLAALSVQDTSGNGVAAASTTFTVNATVIDTTPPAVAITAPSLTAASLLPERIVVVYTDPAGVDASTIRPSNLTVTGPDGALTVASVSNTPAGNSATVTATYSITPPGAGWTTAANGTYTVTFNANQVKDTVGNFSPAQSTDFVVNIPQPGNPNDTTFNGGSPISVPFDAEAAAVLPDGQMLIVGHQGNPGTGESQGVIEMLNADGTIATGFGTNGLVFTATGANEAFYDVIVQGSDFIVAGSDGGFLLQRYDLTGKLDTSFGTSGSVVTSFGGANEAAYTLAINSAGDIAAGGTSSGYFAFAEYNSNGALVTTFGQGGRQLFDVGGATNVVGKILFQSNGDLLAVGGSGSNVALVRLNTSGDADSTFGSSGLVIVPDLTTDTAITTGDRSEGLALESDGSILVANTTSAGHFGLVNLDSGGNLITTFGTNGLATSDFSSDDDADAVFVQPNGSIVVLGTTSLASTPTALAAFDQNGDPIASFGNLGQLTLPAAGVSPAEITSGGANTTAFGIQNAAGYLIVGTGGQASSTTSVRRLIVPGTTIQDTGTPLGAFGVSGRKNLKLTFTLANHTKVTLTLTNGAGEAYMASNGLHLVITAAAKGAALTITARGGAGRVTLGDVTVAGTLRTMAAKTADLAGTLSTTGGLGNISLGHVVAGSIAAVGNISSLTLESAASAKILAGANLAANSFSAGSIRTFKVTGSLTNSTIGAGLNPDANTVTGGSASIIRMITVHSIDAATRFIAGAFGTASIPKRVKKISADPHFEIL
jgi:uncharacterized delta-60 repeat protein